jgi:hypothetical protein
VISKAGEKSTDGTSIPVTTIATPSQVLPVGHAIPKFNSTEDGMVNEKHFVSVAQIATLNSSNPDCDGNDPHYIVAGRRVNVPSGNCGTSQATIQARIDNCNSIHPVEATATACGVTWKLVTKTTYDEVWLDETANRLWSGRIDRENTDVGFNWCKASGVNNINPPYASRDPDAWGGYCNIIDYEYEYVGQINPPISVCFEPGVGSGTYAAKTTQGKAGLGSESVPSVSWYLPTIEDFAIGLKHGMRVVLVHTSLSEHYWSSSIRAETPSYAWTLNSGDGTLSYLSRNGTSTVVRCVAIGPN